MVSRDETLSFRIRLTRFAPLKTTKKTKNIQLCACAYHNFSRLSSVSFFTYVVYDTLRESGPRELDIKARVPQDSLIGPTIFNININDIPTTPAVNIGIYADDTVLYTSSINDEKIVRELNEAITN